MATMAVTREGVCASADVYTKLTGDGAGGTLDDIDVGAGMKSIKTITMSLGLDGAAACDNAVLLRLKGSGLVNGEQGLVMAGTGAEGTPVTYAGEILSYPVDIPVKDGDIQVFVINAGTTSGNPDIGVGLVFSSKPGAAHYECREAAAGTADTWTTVKGDGTTSTTVAEIKSTMGRISEVWHTVGPSSTTQEPFHSQCRVTGLQGAFSSDTDQEHTFMGPSWGAGDGTITHSAMLRA